MTMRGAWLVVVLGGCVATPRPTYTATFTDRAIRIESYARAFRAAEPGLVANLTSDTRLLARIAPKPTAAQLASRDTELPLGAGVWVSREPVDPFLFSDRQTVLEREREGFERVALPADAALQAEVLGARAAGEVTGEEALLRRVKLEQEAFRRLLDAEDARLERERTLPTGSADLVRALSLGWPLRPTSGQLHDLESLVVWRLTNIDEALLPNTLSAAEGDDLLDALTELAPNLGGLQRAMWAVGKVRTTLASTWLTPYALEDERDMDRALYLYVGSPLAFDALDGKLDEAARAFEAQATAGLSVLDAATATRVRANALVVLTAAPACLPRLPVQTPLDMAPPEERAWACSLVHALDDAHTDEGELAVDLAWHDAVVVARWALSTHGPVRSVDAAERLAQPMLALPPVQRTRLMRLARARPMHAIAVGVAAMILMKQGPAHASARAHKWRGIGDAPMDLIDETLR
jgi:hypothetical protein